MAWALVVQAVAVASFGPLAPYLMLTLPAAKFTMEAGITSKDPGGSNTQAMIPNHAVDLMTVMRARTTGAAYQMYRENETGSLEIGKRGDLIVVDQDPFRVQPQELHKTSVVMTFLDGKLIYRRPVSPAAAAP